MNNLKIMVLGYGRHGKDTACEILKEKYNYSFISSSMFCAEKIMLPISKISTQASIVPPKYILPYYDNMEECYKDRHNHRYTWYEAIKDFNATNPTRLGKMIFDKYDIYCGLRNKREFHALKNAYIFDVAIWVDRSDHLPIESKSSCTVEPWMADYVIDNNGSLQELENNIISLMDALHEIL